MKKKEQGHDLDRIVRIGTHTGDDQLRSRLKQHFLNENKDRSIFRKNIGRAILNKENDDFLEFWELDLTTKKAKEKYSDEVDFNKQNQVEKKVSKYIQENFSFVVIQVNSKKDRLFFEAKLIATISNCNECKSSFSWLGNFSPKLKIIKSGLWQVNELFKENINEQEIKKLKKIIKQH